MASQGMSTEILRKETISGTRDGRLAEDRPSEERGWRNSWLLWVH
jgi:hypothetical protein